MGKTIKCPICNHEINVNVANGFTVIFDKPLRDLPYIVWCDNCKRKIKYDLLKVAKDKE